MTTKNFELLKDEKIEIFLRPHVLSFLKYYSACLYLIFLAVALHMLHQWLHWNVWSNPAISNILNTLFGFIPGVDAESLLSLVVFWVVLVLSGLLIGVLWISKMPLIYMILIGISGTLVEVYLFPTPSAKVLVLFLSAIVGLILTEAYRRGHQYFLTNYRIVTIKKFIGKESREITYDKISDLYVAQGILGRIFNFGTIIPISESGFGLGEDAALAALSAGVSIGKGSIGVTFGGKKGVSRPRAATYFSLYGVPNLRRVRGIIGSKILGTKEAPILRRIEDLLRDRKEKEKSDEDKGA